MTDIERELAELRRHQKNLLAMTSALQSGLRWCIKALTCPDCGGTGLLDAATEVKAGMSITYKLTQKKCHCRHRGGDEPNT